MSRTHPEHLLERLMKSFTILTLVCAALFVQRDHWISLKKLRHFTGRPSRPASASLDCVSKPWGTALLLAYEIREWGGFCCLWQRLLLCTGSQALDLSPFCGSPITEIFPTGLPRSRGSSAVPRSAIFGNRWDSRDSL